MFTSDEALDLAFVPEYVAIVGSGYIGLEFSDVYTALGSEVTFIEVRRKKRITRAIQYYSIIVGDTASSFSYVVFMLQKVVDTNFN